MDSVHDFNLTVYLPKVVIMLLSLTVLMLGCNDAARDAEPDFFLTDPDGKELFNNSCAANCHGIDNRGTANRNVRPVDFDFQTLQAIKDAINNVPAMTIIPDLATLSDHDIQAIADYLLTIKPDANELYNDFCATSCHGIDNLGTPGAGVGPIDVATFQAIKDAIWDIPEMIRPDLSLLRDSEIRAIADYIPTIP